jgi:hypothetical protein
MWRQREGKPSLELLEMRSSDPEPVDLKIVGQQIDHKTHVLHTIPYPNALLKLPTDLASLTHIYSSRPPIGTISIQSPVLQKTRLVGTHTWLNIWIYGQEVILAGWCTKGYFRSHSRFLPKRSRTRMGWRLSEDHRSLPLSQLHPMRELAARIRQG